MSVKGMLRSPDYYLVLHRKDKYFCNHSAFTTICGLLSLTLFCQTVKVTFSEAMILSDKVIYTSFKVVYKPDTLGLTLIHKLFYVHEPKKQQHGFHY